MVHSALVVALTLLIAPPADARQTSLAHRLILAEDARAQSDAELATLRQALTNRDPVVRQQAVRALGRLERPEHIRTITRTLADPNPDVRIEAANAVGQMARGERGVAAARSRLVSRARVEKDPRVWGVVAATLGRLPYTSAADVDEAEALIARVLPSASATTIQIDAVLGAVEGLEALARQSGKISRLKPATLEGLRAASAVDGSPGDADKLARIRRLATQALTASGAVIRPGLERGAADPDDEVRRLTMVAARADVEGREEAINRGLADGNARVRYEAVQSWGAALQKTSCAPLLRALRDPDPHVSLLAIDLLGNGCPDGELAAAPLQALTATLTSEPRQWHAPAHALVALATVAPAEARKALPRFMSHATWQVRMYAARAAGPIGAIAELEQLGRDAHDNVREAALRQLMALKRPEAALLALDALTRPDYQLVLTASRALANSGEKEAAVAALLHALARITAEQRETSRDPRMAILDRLEELASPDGGVIGGGPGVALAPYLVDFDAAVARRTADILRRWQQPASAAPRPLARWSIDPAAIDALHGVTLRFVMAGRGAFDLRLLVDEAPVTALRVATRAREGYYNGLTFHRIAPNFVIQGGSPGANEYSGDALYMRDEVGIRSHRRGTVGISTRGRDTGDAQIFVNLVDSPRLDHMYTVFAEVASGMAVVDALIEGDVIERVEIVAAPR
jgi:cyclophilin family peptidyl-prolyl cis-trans isomerase/HEAT repeat protein